MACTTTMKATLCECGSSLQAKQQLAEMMWVRQSESIVLEALVRLAAVGEELERRHQDQQQPLLLQQQQQQQQHQAHAAGLSGPASPS